MEALVTAILSLPVSNEIEYGKWTVYRMDRSTWKAHITGTHPDSTGEFLDGASAVREWAASAGAMRLPAAPAELFVAPLSPAVEKLRALRAAYAAVKDVAGLEWCARMIRTELGKALLAVEEESQA